MAELLAACTTCLPAFRSDQLAALGAGLVLLQVQPGDTWNMNFLQVGGGGGAGLGFVPLGPYRSCLWGVGFVPLGPYRTF